MKKTFYLFLMLGLAFLGACGSEKTTEVQPAKEEVKSKTEIKLNTKNKEVNIKTNEIEVEVNGNNKK
jgi:hypothetical protein